MTQNRQLQDLHDLGQSLWLDNISRDLLDNGTLQRYIDEFSITGLTSTTKGCAADIVSLEAQYGTALGQVSTFDIAGDTLTLRDSAGAAQVVLRHA